MENKNCKDCDFNMDGMCGHPDSNAFLYDVNEEIGCEYWTEKVIKTK